MEWFNIFGLVFIIVIMIPNIVFAIKCKEDFENKWSNKIIELLEQIGRFAINCPLLCYMGYLLEEKQCFQSISTFYNTISSFYI